MKIKKRQEISPEQSCIECDKIGAELKAGTLVTLRLSPEQLRAVEWFKRIHCINFRPDNGQVVQVIFSLALITPEQISRNCSSVIDYWRAEGFQEADWNQEKVLLAKIAAVPQYKTKRSIKS